MNKIIFLFLTCFFLAGNYSTAQWEILNEGFKGYIRTIDFVDEYTGWMSGDNGTLLVTSDGGESWSYIQFPENIYIRHIDFINCSTGWAVCEGDVQGTWTNFIWKTTDGGFDWNEQFSTKDYGLNSIFAVDDQNCFAAGGNRILRTTNSGAIWVNVVPLKAVEYYSIWFSDPQNGFSSGIYTGEPARGVILETTDGGLSWEEKFLHGFYGIYDLQFTDSSTGYFRTNNDSVSFLCGTTDSGNSWKFIAQSRYGIPSYHTANDGSVYAVIADSIECSFQKTTDGGVTWQNITRLPYLSVDKIFINRITKKGFISGNADGYFMLLTSTEPDYRWSIKNFSYPLTDIIFINKDTGNLMGGFSSCGRHGCWAAGRIFKTGDGGKIWEMVFASYGSILKNCFFINDIVGYSVSPTYSRNPSITKLFKTSDCGKSWLLNYETGFADTAGIDFQGADICFIDQNTGFISGRYWYWSGEEYKGGAGILYTVNAGETWDSDWQFPDKTDTSFYDLLTLAVDNNSGTCWAAGEKGMIVKYTPQSGWVKKDSVTDLPLNRVFFRDNYHGWIAGGYHNIWDSTLQSICLKTTDGGGTWEVNENLPYLINDLYFTDNEHGWAVGCNKGNEGVILETTNGGSTWNITADKLPGALKSIFFKDNYAWAVGDNGLIIRNTNIVSVGYDNTNIHPTEFILEQNFPNPFNPNTLIRYQLPVAGRVRLKVFDILGNEAAVLVDEYKPAGNYKVEFNAKKLASGVYFYRLKAGEFVQTKKMTLIK